MLRKDVRSARGLAAHLTESLIANCCPSFFRTARWVEPLAPCPRGFLQS